MCIRDSPNPLDFTLISTNLSLPDNSTKVNAHPALFKWKILWRRMNVYTSKSVQGWIHNWRKWNRCWGVQVHLGEKPLEVNSVKKLVSHQIYDICRQEAEEQAKGRKWENVCEQWKINKRKPMKVALATFSLITTHGYYTEFYWNANKKDANKWITME